MIIVKTICLGAGAYEPYHRHSAEERQEYEEKCGVVNGHEVSKGYDSSLR